MKLTCHWPYLSIKAFPPIELPSFTLITGLNGAGKTHLLKGIKEGRIGVDDARTPQNEIRLFDWLTMVPGDAGAFDGQVLIQERAQIWQQLETIRQQYDLGLGLGHMRPDEGPDGIIRAAARSVGLSDQQSADPKAVARLQEADLVAMLGDLEKARIARAAIADSVARASEIIRGQLGGNQLEIESVAARAKKPIYLLDREDMLLGRIPSWGRTDLFQQSFARLFVAYRDLVLDNHLKQFQRHKGRLDVSALSDEAFVEEYGRRPWEVVNETFAIAGLGFEIDYPAEFTPLPYQPTLKKLGTGAAIRFNDLSSGEKILMSFALCLYYAEDRRQLATYPKVLLFDEVDAPLHPSMSRNLLRIVTDILVKRYGIRVIATTHSASTVALAPEEALYVMYSDQAGLHKTTKGQALNALTVGVPALALSYDGRRQVFVESAADAELYDRIYTVLRPRLGSERSLEFIGTGTKAIASGTEVNAGCNIVVRLVKNLVDAGNGSIYGLVDWDGTNTPSERIAVLAHGRRDGIENLVFDPLLLGALILHDARKHVGQIGVDAATSYREFLSWPAERLQVVADRVQRAVLGTDAPATIKCSYEGHFSLVLRKDYLCMDDHELEGRALTAFPALKGFAKRAGALMLHMVEAVMNDQPGFIPIEFSETFRDLLEAPSHSTTEEASLPSQSLT